MELYHVCTLNTKAVKQVYAGPTILHLDDDRRRALESLRPEWKYEIWERDRDGNYQIDNETISKLIIKARRQVIEDTIPEALNKFVR